MFIEGHIYKRSVIHDKYGGNRQSGISPSAQSPNIFIFSGSSGSQYGYKDEWLNEEVFSYTGEGQEGDMSFTKGNLALRDSLKNGKQVFLFEYVAKGMVKYVSELKFLDCDYFHTLDVTGTTRIGIKFFFKRQFKDVYVIPDELQYSTSLLDAQEDYKKKFPNVTQREGLVTSRVGQGAYRKSILHRWKYKCAVTDYNDPKVLIASHILPWKDSNDQQRLDVDNGILLSPDYDALFDKHLISFDSSSGNIILNSKLSLESVKSLGIKESDRISNISEGNRHYLDMHRLKCLNSKNIN